MVIIEMLNSLGIPALLCSLVLLFVSRHYTKKDKDEEEKKKNMEKDRIEKYNKLENDIKSIKCTQEEYQSALEDNNRKTDILGLAMQSILRDRIVSMYHSYAYDKKFFPTTARESLKGMYEQYHNLGGNGVITKLVDKLYELPLKPPDDYVGLYEEE